MAESYIAATYSGLKAVFKDTKVIPDPDLFFDLVLWKQFDDPSFPPGHLSDHYIIGLVVVPNQPYLVPVDQLMTLGIVPDTYSFAGYTFICP